MSSLPAPSPRSTDPTQRPLSDWLVPTTRPGTWPRPPAALVAARLDEVCRPERFVRRLDRVFDRLKNLS